MLLRGLRTVLRTADVDDSSSKGCGKAYLMTQEHTPDTTATVFIACAVMDCVTKGAAQLLQAYI